MMLRTNADVKRRDTIQKVRYSRGLFLAKSILALPDGGPQILGDRMGHHESSIIMDLDHRNLIFESRRYSNSNSMMVDRWVLSSWMKRVP